MYKLYQEQFLPVDLETAWSFFTSPFNLKKITPPYMGFEIVSKDTKSEIFEGQLIDYKVKPVLSIPMFWRTEIKNVIYRREFTDTQLRGPYKQWIHRHRFVKKDHGVLMIDEIDYEVPFSIFGKLAHALFIRRQLKGIFEYRKQVLNNTFRNGNID